jgi:transposase InsO family protein
MVTLEEILHTIEKLDLPPLGREYAKRVAISPPSRRVGSRGSNVVCRFPSKKMGVTIQAESHRCELPLVYVLDRKPEYVAFWDQPESIKISYQTANGHLVSPMTTPDYLVLKKDGLEWIEAKMDDTICELAKEKPYRYARGVDGKWHSPPAELTAHKYGFGFRIWTPSEVDPTWLLNIRLLQEYFGADLNLVSTDVRKQILEEAKCELGIQLADLRQRCKSATADDVNLLIAHEELFVDLAAAPLNDPTRVKVFASRETADTYLLLNKKQNADPSQESREQSTIGGTNQGTRPQLSEAGIQLLRGATPEDHTTANHRLRILTDPEYAKAHQTPKRTVRRWRKLFRLAEERYDSGLLGLFPRFKDRGNRYQRFDDPLLTLVDRIIEEVYCTATRPSKQHTYDQLRLACEQNGFFLPSKSWLNKRLSSRSKYKDTLSRQGKRAAHRYEVFRPGEPNQNHGAFPWDVCLTDHTLCDVELVVCSETGETCRPWLSILLDGFSRKILAFCLTFDPPSYRTLMMLVRNCVERHNRLPGCLVVDNGKEFQSTYFENLTAFYSIILKRRPPGKARFGSLIERMFGTINTQFLHTLAGNTQNTRDIRQLTKSMDPKGHAIYTLQDLHAMLSTYAFEIYDKRVHPTLNCSPAEKFDQGIEISGAREHRRIDCDEAFHLMTLPTTPKGTAKIQPGMGVKILGFYYWSAEIRSPRFEGNSVRVKYDPEDLGIAWAYLGVKWVQCRPSRTLNLEGRTEKELKIATLEWRRSSQLLGKRQSSSHKHLAEFLKTTAQNKALQLQRAKDRALRMIRVIPAVDASNLASPAAEIKPDLIDPQASTTPSSPDVPLQASPTTDYGNF